MTQYRLYLSLFASGLVLSACATTSVNSRTPEDIAARSFPILDNYTGLEQIRLPSIKQGGWSDNRVTAYLQTAEAYQGQEGGAWLDVVINYETPTPDPNEMQVFNRGVWAGGAPLQLADFSATVLSCAEQIESYGSGYYGGGHGYYGGGYYGGGNYGYRRGRHGGRGGYHDRDDDHDGRGSGDRGGRGGVGDGGSGSGGGDDRPNPNPNTVRPSPEDLVPPGTNPTRYRRGAGPMDRRIAPDERDEPARPRPRRSVSPAPSISRPAPTPVTRPEPAPRPAPVSRPAPASVARPAPTPRSEPAPVSRPAPASKPKAAPVSRRRGPERELKGMHYNDEANARANGAVALSYHGGGRGIYRAYNRGVWPRSYWGGGYYSPYRDGILITQSCQRREQLRVFVPRAQLQDAQGYDGLTLLLRGQGGLQRQVRLSQNYVRGYALASRDFIPPRPVDSAALSSDSAIVPQ